VAVRIVPVQSPDVGPGIEEARLTALIEAFVPAHVPWRLELLPDDTHQWGDRRHAPERE
jgi:hypothetical protein